MALRERKLDIVAARSPSQRVAFSRDRVGTLTDAELVTRDVEKFGVVARLAIEEPRRVLTAVDGSLVVLARRVSHRLSTRPPALASHGPVPLFADTLVFGDRMSADLLWVKHPFGEALYGYRLGSGGASGLALEAELPLDGCDGALAGLRDGSFVYTAAGRLHHMFPRGRRLESRGRAAEVWRLLPARRIDQLWSAREDGRLELLQIGSGFVSIRALEAGRGVFDVDASEQYLALVTVEQGDGRPRRWHLKVLDLTGKSALEVELPPDTLEPRGPDWVRDLTRDRHVVLSPFAPLVAVGGPTWLGVWNVKSGAPVYTGAP
jgi:hypothetical protein